MIPLVKHFLHGHVDLTSIPSTHAKLLSMAGHSSGPNSKVVETGVSGTCWPESLVE